MTRIQIWKWIEYTYLKIFLSFWILTAIGSSFMHLFKSEYLVSLTSWQFAKNWQMEIAFFDVSWSCFILYAFKTKNHNLQKQIAIILGCLSLFLGTNHFSGYLIESKLLHLLFAIINYIGAASSVLFFVAHYKGKITNENTKA